VPFWATSHVRDERTYRLDLVSACRFLRKVLGDGIPLALVGYSFGCALLPHAAEPHNPLVLIAPTVGTHDYELFTILDCPLLLITSEDDFAAPTEGVQEWFDRLRAPRALVRGNFDNHFFRGHEAWLTDTVFSFLREQGGVPSCP
jgi:alpha/beta superfamily hydrolase